MKQQLLESRQTLINHLEQKILQLKKQRTSLLNQQDNCIPQPSQHINIKSYLKQQGRPDPIKKNKMEIAQLYRQHYSEQSNIPPKSKGDMLRQQIQTKQKLQKLKDLYDKKRELESIGIYENNLNKINGMYNNKDTKSKIDKKVVQNKKKKEAKLEKDKIIKQQLERVEACLKKGKTNQAVKTKLPENHYSRLIVDRQQFLKYEQLIKKNTLKLTEKEKLLQKTFEVIKEPGNYLQQQKLKTFLLSNPQFCQKFYITKNEIIRDLQVHPTSTQGIFTYQQFYQMLKAIEITNKALYPNFNYQAKQQSKQERPNIKREVNFELQHKKEMEKYLKALFIYFDPKSEKIINRQRYEIALKKGLLFDDKKYKYIKKGEIIEFGQNLQKKKGKLTNLEYYKSLDMKYIGLQQILEYYKKFCQKQQNNNQISEQNFSRNEQELNQSQFNEIQKEKSFSEDPLPKQQLQEKDFEQYGWGQPEQVHNFKDLKQLDKYYQQTRNKYGNQIYWNGFQRYRQDFSRFNQCIKKLNEANTKTTQ